MLSIIVDYKESKGTKASLVICPSSKDCSSCTVSCEFMDKCQNCYENIHFLSLRMGCITAEEILFVLEQQIDLSFKDGKHVKHIFIEDLQKIDYSFPLLKSNKLFLSALVTFCRDRKVDLTILSDKKASLTQELCTLADNVICMEREVKDRDRAATIRIERSSQPHEISKIMSYKIKDMLKLFRCDSESKEFIINNGDNGYYDIYEIGSMKGYWRKTVHVVDKE